MKKLVVVAALLTSVVVNAQEAPRIPIALIDVQRIVEESAAGKEAMGRVRRLGDEKTAQARKLIEEYEGLQRQLATQRATLTETRVAELQKRIEDKQVEINRFQEDAREQLMEAERNELAALERRIMPIIEQVGKEMKLQLIFNKFQAGLLYADDTVDITETVLRRFNTAVGQ